MLISLSPPCVQAASQLCKGGPVQTAPISLAAVPPDIRWQQRFANFCQGQQWNPGKDEPPYS